MKIVVFDADVLGRQRTGDETYALNLLRELGGLARDADVRLIAVTRRADLVPEGVEPVGALDRLAGAAHGLDVAQAPSPRRRGPRAHAVRVATSLPVPRRRHRARRVVRTRRALS